ncbi:MAG: protein ImuB [Rhodothermales bacterium]|jgi:protein ImuB
MDQMACVSIPSFSLQLLLRKHPEWASQPVAVLDKQQSAGKLLAINEPARRRGLRAGMRYAAALGLARELVAAPVSEDAQGAAVSELVDCLQGFSPSVEAAESEPGIFWLAAGGLERLYGSPLRWARQLRCELRNSGLASSVVAGFTRYGSYAVAKSWHGAFAFRDEAAERKAADSVAIADLALPRRLRKALNKLGLRTMGQVLALPPGTLSSRFGREAEIWRRQAANAVWEPLQPADFAEPLMNKLVFEPSISDTRCLSRVADNLVAELLPTLEQREKAVRTVVLHLFLDNYEGSMRSESVHPARPTRDLRQLSELIALRMHALDLSCPVSELAVELLVSTQAPVQLSLFATEPARDLAAAERVLARLRSEFGEGAVVYAECNDAYLPEERWRWCTVGELNTAMPLKTEPLLVRRLHQPVAIRRPSQRPECGPYRIATRWWQKPITRNYYFTDGRWLFHDGQRWYEQGRVE